MITLPAESTDQSDEVAVESHDQEPDPANETPEDNSEELESVAKEKEEVKDKVLTPYGLPCVRELLRFLVSIINTQDR